jgi:hypothetical protein
MNVAPDHPDKVVGHMLLAEALRTANAVFKWLFGQVANASSKKTLYQFSLIRTCEPNHIARWT